MRLVSFTPSCSKTALARTAGLEQTPAFEDCTHGRKLAPVRPIVGGDVQDVSRARRTSATASACANARSLAGDKSVG